MSENKELNTLLDKLFNSVKTTYDIGGMIKTIKEKEFWNDEKAIEFAKFSQRNRGKYSDSKEFPKAIDDFKKLGELKDKEVAEKDYEILSFKGLLSTNKGLFVKKEDGLFYHQNWEGTTETGMEQKWFIDQNHINTVIHSVKRKSDNEAFCIGDKTDEGTIKSFYIEDNILWVRTEEKGGAVSLNDIQKVKERVPLFTTEDGKDIFEDDTYWTMDASDFNFWYSGAAAECYDSGKDKGVKYFSTEDKAKEYIKWNKELFSLAQIMAVSEYVVGNGRMYKFDRDKLIELAQKKIDDQA